jgi:hypothetical protein
LRFEGLAPEVSVAVTKDGEDVGTVTSSSGEVGLGLVRRGVAPGDVVSVGEHQATVEAVPQA